MNRNEMLLNLHKLDEKLWTSLEIQIVGASSAILQNALKRSSGDIDVLNASFSLTDPKIKKILDEIGKNPNERESWLNQNAREDILRKLPSGYKFDEVVIAGETFEKLHPRIISKADFVICKLLIEEDKRRLHDLKDIRDLKMDDHDVEKIYEKLNKIAIMQQPVALKAEGLFKQIRQEFLVTEQDLPYSNSEEIAEYNLKRYGVEVTNQVKEQWRDEIDQMIKRPAIIIGEIDYNAGIEIEAGNIVIAKKDRNYRRKLEKEIDYGMEL